MRKNRFHLACVTALLASLGQACSSAPPPERFMSLESDSKRTFIAYYPLLTPSQRRELLDGGASEFLARDWALENELSKGKGPVVIPHYLLNPASYTLVDLRINDGDNATITKGTEIPLRAEIIYQDGRKADVTHDVHWSAEPDIARVDDSKLLLGCLDSDITVGADFYHERDGTTTFHIRKPIEKLELRVEGDYLAFDRTEFTRIQLIAVCQDGTSTDVSCEGDWSSRSPAIRVEACGSVRILSKERVDRGPITIKSEYGGMSVSRAFRLEQFKK